MPPERGSSRRVDHNGWFEIDANPISKVGVFQYSGRFISPELDADKLYTVYRPPEELSDPACIESFKLLPWTNDHPRRLLGAVDGSIAPEDKGIEGIIGEKVFFDPAAGMLKANIKVFSKQHADLINAGKKELSAGYHCKYEYAPGEWKGQPYQFVQREIRGNHLASVDSGRMGPDVSVMDGFRFTIDSSEWRHMKKTNKIRKMMNTLIRYAQDSEEELERIEEKERSEIETLSELVGKVAPLMDQIAALPTIMAKTEMEEEAVSDEDDPASDPLAELAQAERTKEETTDDEEESEEKTEPGEEGESEEENEKEEESAMDAMELIKKTLGEVKAELAAMKAAQPKPAQTMDAKEVMVQLSRRDMLAKSLWPFTGVFDHAEMTIGEVASYGVSKLGIKVDKGAELAALTGFLAGRKPPEAAPAFAQDGKEKEGGWLDRQREKKEN